MHPKSAWYYPLVSFGMALSVAFTLGLSSVKAEPSSLTEANYDESPLDIEIVKNPSSAQRKPNIITADTIENFSAFRSSMPSLWWVQDQLPNKLVLNWLAYPEKKRIDLVVNPQFWNNLEYTERYKLINRYGTVARYYGYNVRIFNLKFSEAKPIVAYTCSHNVRPLACKIQWQEISRRSIRVNTSK